VGPRGVGWPGDAVGGPPHILPTAELRTIGAAPHAQIPTQTPYSYVSGEKRIS
jgi:hypothetical protein